MDTNLTLTTRFIQAAGQAVRALLWLIAGVWVLVALAWVLLQFWIVPRIDEIRPHLERQATRALGVPVSIGGVRLHQSGVMPSFELTDIVLRDAASRPALHLSSVVGTVSPRSLFWLGFEQLVIDSPDLDIRRGRDGVVRVAGLDFSHGEGSDGQAADWFFSQPECVIRHGRVQWADDYKGRPAVALADVSVVARNRGRRHDVRIDASPPAGWGERFSVTGRFRQPLLVGRSGDWMNWSGTLYARFSHVDVRQLHQQVSLDLEVKNAAGGLQAWVDWERGQVSGTTLDVALSQFQGRLAPDMAVLDLRQVRGRLDMRRLSGGLELVTRGLTFDTPDGGHWPGSDVRFEYVGGEGSLPGRGRLVTGVIDVDVLAGLVLKLPVGASVHDALRRHAPAGRLEHLDAAWETRGATLSRFSARGRATDVSLQAVPAPATDDGTGHVALGIPGLSRASVDFDVTEQSGRLQLGLNAGAIVLPGVWEAPAVRLDRLNADVQWEVKDAREGPALSVRVRRLQWANPDMAGELSGQWRTSRVGEAAPGHRFPGVVDVSGRLQRGDLSQLHRYLPLAVLPQVRQYLRESLVAGEVKSATFRVKGEVTAFPFANSRKDGEFTLLAQVANARYDYAPEMVRPAGSALWPALEGVSAEVALDRASLEVRKARGGFVGWPALQWSQSRARVPDLLHQPAVDVQLDLRGPLSDALGWVNASPVNAMLHGVLQPMSATGPLDLRLKLHLPVQQLAQSRVQGALVLGGNDLDLGPTVPVLGNVQGSLAFTDADLGFSGVKATVVGGEASLEGSLSRANDPPGALVVRAQGMASAEGLRASERLGWVSRLALFAQGQTAYQLQLRMLQGYPELEVRLPLEGMAVGLPMPLTKPAASAFPVRLSTRLVPAVPSPQTDRLLVELGNWGQMEWVRDIRVAAAPRVLRGSMAVGLVGSEAAPMPDSGVLGNVRLDVLDLDAWQGVARRLLPAAVDRPPAALAQGAASSGAAVLDAYLPTILGLRANEVRGDARVLKDVVLGGSRIGSVWRATVDARELNGYVEVDLGQGGNDGMRLLARLSRLQVPRSLAGDVQQLLEQAPEVLPALDIVAEAFEWNGRALGRLELEGRPVLMPSSRMRAPVRDWALHRFVLSVPEATVQASGRWRPPGPLVVLVPGAARGGEMELDVQSDITDVGALLNRLGMDNLVRAGKGRLQGRLGWSGSPLSPDYPSMRGHLALDLQAGQFLRADPGAARLLGILSLQSLPRRLALDFRDVFNEGFRFDTARGQADIKEGVAHFDGVRIKGIAAAVAVEGSADLVRETQQLHVVVVPDINAGTASLLTALVNPAMGLSTLLAQTLLSQPLSQAASQELVVDGTWSEPRVTRIERAATAPVDGVGTGVAPTGAAR